MIRHVAFLRGVNLGRRTMRSADLKAAAARMGLGAPATLLASGNLLFDAPPDADLATRLETHLEAEFGFPIGVVLRRQQTLRDLVASRPFGDRAETDEMKLYVMLLGAPLAAPLAFPALPAGVEVPRIDADAIFLIGHRQPNGRYSEGLDGLEKHLPKGVLATTRNWNTIVKAAA